MKAMHDLRRFILAKCNSEDKHEIREYIRENICELARDLCVTTSTVNAALASVQDDSALGVRFLEVIRRSEALQKDVNKVARSKAAQASADAVASLATWNGETVHVDMATLLSSSLTRRDDLLVLATEEFSVAVYMAPLFDLKKLKRKDVTAFVDPKGLHIRWKTGGLNLMPQVDPRAGRIVLTLPSRLAAVAA